MLGAENCEITNFNAKVMERNDNIAFHRETWLEQKNLNCKQERELKQLVALVAQTQQAYEESKQRVATENEAVRAEATCKLHSVEEALEAETAMVRKMQGQIDLNSAQVVTATEVKDSCTESLKECEAKLTEMEQRLADLNSQHTELRAVNAELDVVVKSKDREIVSVTNELDASKKMNELLEKNDAAKRILEEYTTQRTLLKEKDIQIEGLQSENEKFVHQTEALNIQILGFEQRLMDAKTVMIRSEWYQQTELKDAENAKQQVEIKSLECVGEDLQKKIECMARKIEQQTALQDEEALKRAELESKLKKTHLAVDSSKEEFCQSENHIADVQQEIGMLKTQLTGKNELERQNSSMAQQINELAGTVEERTADLARESSEFERLKNSLQGKIDQTNIYVNELVKENTTLQNRIDEAKKREAYVTGDLDAKDSGVLDLVDEYERTASRAEAKRKAAEKELKVMTDQVVVLQHQVTVQEEAVKTITPARKGLKDKMTKLQQAKTTNMQTHKSPVFDRRKDDGLEGDLAEVRSFPRLQDTKQTTQRSMLAKRLYKGVNSNAIPIKTKTGVGYITQAAYLRKLTHAKTERDGTMRVEGLTDLNEAEEIIQKILEKSDAERFIEQAKAQGGVLARKKHVFTVYTTTTQSSSGAVKSATDRIAMIFAIRSIKFTLVDLNEEPWKQEEMESKSNGLTSSLPRIFIDDKLIMGGSDEFQVLHEGNKLAAYNMREWM